MSYPGRSLRCFEASKLGAERLALNTVEKSANTGRDGIAVYGRHQVLGEHMARADRTSAAQVLRWTWAPAVGAAPHAAATTAVGESLGPIAAR